MNTLCTKASRHASNMYIYPYCKSSNTNIARLIKLFQ